MISAVCRDSLLEKRAVNTSDHVWVTDAKIAHRELYLPESYGNPRVDDRLVSSGLIFINRSGFLWRNSPKELDPNNALSYTWKR